MKKSSQWVGVLAIGIVSASSLAGCSADPSPGPVGTAGAGTAGSPSGGGSGGAAGGARGIQLSGPAAYTILSGPDAAPGAAAPAAWVGKGCSACHGPNGEGVNQIGPEIRHTPTTYGTWVVRNGRAPFIMASFPEVPTAMKTDISAADLSAVLTWLQSLPKPTTGEGLYKNFCGNCHGPKMGTGGIVPISVVGKKQLDVSQTIRLGEGTDPSMRGTYMPAQDVASLTDAEIALINQFIMAVP